METENIFSVSCWTVGKASKCNFEGCKKPAEWHHIEPKIKYVRCAGHYCEMHKCRMFMRFMGVWKQRCMFGVKEAAISAPSTEGLHRPSGDCAEKGEEK